MDSIMMQPYWDTGSGLDSETRPRGVAVVKTQ